MSAHFSYFETLTHHLELLHRISGLKSQVLKPTFQLKNDGEKGSRIFILKFYQPLRIPANLPGQFSLSGQIFLHWAAATLKGLVEIQNKKILDHFLLSFLAQKCWFQDLRFQSTYSTSSRWCDMSYFFELQQKRLTIFKYYHIN